MVSPSAVMVEIGGLTDLLMYDARSYPLRRAVTWRLHIKKLKEVSLVTFSILTLRRVGVSPIVIVSFDVTRQEDMFVVKNLKKAFGGSVF